MKNIKEIYLDHASTTPIRKEVLKEALPFFENNYGNPSSFHSSGLIAKKAMQESRNKIAKILNCESKEIIFTGSGTESINLAIKGIAFKSLLKGERGTIITQKTEHHAVLESTNWLKKLGFNIIEINTDEEGIIKIDELRNVLENQRKSGEKVLLISIMYANNEIGTIQPISEIADIAHEYDTLLHTDACQGAEYLSLDTKKLNVDLMTINGSKIYALKGTGLLFKKKEIEIEALIHGGGHEGGMRAGTENVAGIVALASALELAEKEKLSETKRLTKLRDYFSKKIQKEIPKTILNGSKHHRLPNNINISFEGVEGESILLRLNEYGIRASTGSACTSQSLEPSHVLMAIGLPHELAHSSIRFTLGKTTTKKELEYTAKKLKEIIKFLRAISPVWEGGLRK